MKAKFLYIILGIAIITSCSSKKTVVEEEATPVKEVAVAETAAQMDGKKLFERSCASCHKLYEPSDFNAEQWKPIMARMQKKARLNDAEALAIYAYLTQTPQ